jgi:hypothetical protein
MKRVKSLVILVSLVLVAACTPPKPVAFLQSAQDRATQTDIRARMGEPRSTTSQPGGAVWVYEFWDHEYGSRFQPSSAWCDEYRLRFDQAGILREWEHHRDRHPGEMMPASCRRPV